MTSITKKILRERLGVTTDAAIADFFGISASAVSQWELEEPIPELRQLQAERKKPDLFGPSALSADSEAA